MSCSCVKLIAGINSELLQFTRLNFTLGLLVKILDEQSKHQLFSNIFRLTTSKGRLELILLKYFTIDLNYTL